MTTKVTTTMIMMIMKGDGIRLDKGNERRANTNANRVYQNVMGQNSTTIILHGETTSELTYRTLATQILSLERAMPYFSLFCHLQCEKLRDFNAFPVHLVIFPASEP